MSEREKGQITCVGSPAPEQDPLPGQSEIRVFGYLLSFPSGDRSDPVTLLVFYLIFFFFDRRVTLPEVSDGVALFLLGPVGR